MKTLIVFIYIILLSIIIWHYSRFMNLNGCRMITKLSGESLKKEGDSSEHICVIGVAPSAGSANIVFEQLIKETDDK